MSNFAGTAEDYDEYRPGVPITVLDTVMNAVSKPVTLLDLGCGTGRITEQFAPFFQEVLCVEPDREMAKVARRRLQAYPVEVLHETAEDMQLPDGWRASLVVIARAFHWMDREVVLARLKDVVARDGVIAVFHDHSFWHVEDPWAVRVRELVQSFLGHERRTLSGSYQPPEESLEAAFENSVFTQLERHRVDVVRTWTADQIAGYLRSSSFASRALLKEKADQFERELRTLLAQLSPNDLFTEHNHFNIVLARRSPVD